MSASLPAALVWLVFLSSTMSVAQSSTEPPAEAPPRRTVELSTMGPRDVPEVRIHPESLTALLMDAPLRLAGVELEAHEQFSRMTVVGDALLLVPSIPAQAGMEPRSSLHPSRREQHGERRGKRRQPLRGMASNDTLGC